MRLAIDDATLEHLREVVQDESGLRDLLRSLYEASLDDRPASLRTPTLDRLLPLALDTLARFNTKWMFYYCESPIERIVVGSLLAIHARSTPLSLVMTPNFLHSLDPLQAFGKIREDMKRFTSEPRFSGSVAAFLDHIGDCVNNGVIAPATFDFMRDHYMFYNLLDLSSAFHLSLQPAMKHIRIRGRTVRPDLLFWSPLFRTSASLSNAMVLPVTQEKTLLHGIDNEIAD